MTNRPSVSDILGMWGERRAAVVFEMLTETGIMEVGLQRAHTQILGWIWAHNFFPRKRNGKRQAGPDLTEDKKDRLGMSLQQELAR